MPEQNDIKLNNLPEEVKKEYTDEFILLGILSLAKNFGYKLQRMQIMKILQKFKQRTQEDIGLEAYHSEFIKEKHGDFNPKVYDQLSDLKQADFITTEGIEPYENFFPTKLGSEVFSRIKMGSGDDNKKLNVVKELLLNIVKSEAPKTSEELKKENHERKIMFQGKEITVDQAPKGIVTTPNLHTNNVFVFDDRVAIDWSLYRKIAKRKREPVVPEAEIPQSQEDVYKLIGI